MDAPPSLDEVYLAINALYYNPDRVAKEKASRWLDQLQKSVYGWKIADELLHKKVNLEACYFGAQTMRTKIQFSFHELPRESYSSLKDSLLDHLSHVNQDTQPIIVTQLCLALADLALQMSEWKTPITDLIIRFGGNNQYHSALLELLKVLPEEINSKSLLLGLNRRNQITESFQAVAPQVVEFLRACVEVSDIKIRCQVFRCLGSWFSVVGFPMHQDANLENLLKIIFLELANSNTISSLHDAATDCVCNALVLIEDCHRYEYLAGLLFQGVYQLLNAYHTSVSMEEMDKSINYCRMFTELAESLVDQIVQHPTQGFGNLQTLDILLTCVGHHDYEVAEITFNFWYTLSELLFNRNNETLNKIFEPYIKRLIVALCRHCQLDPDHEGIPDEKDDFCNFRLRVSDLIKDVIFIVGSSTIFVEMFENLKQQGNSATWDVTEASLFIMASVAKNILPTENHIVHQVLEALLMIPSNSHISIHYTSIQLIGELADWLEKNPGYIDQVMAYLLNGLKQQPLSIIASNALQNLCASCQRHMSPHFQTLLTFIQSSTSDLPNEAVVGLLKAATTVLMQMPPEMIASGFWQLCQHQLNPLSELLRDNTAILTNNKSNSRKLSQDPCVWFDQLAMIFRTGVVFVHNGQTVHPCRPTVEEVWPVLSQAMNKYQADIRITERLCRCIRFLVRCMGKHSAFILESLVSQMVQLYHIHFHSCYLYLGSILVDEYGHEESCHQGLLGMLQAFCTPTFQLLNEMNGFKNHPDTVDDFFRLCSRFLLRCPLILLQSSLITDIFTCGLLASKLDHKDANASVMKFFLEFVKCGRSKEEEPDFEQRRCHVVRILAERGQELISTLLEACLFHLPTFVLPDIADVIYELVLLDKQMLQSWLELALQTVPAKGITGPITVTQEQLLEFHNNVSNAQHPKTVSISLREFARLFK